MKLNRLQILALLLLMWLYFSGPPSIPFVPNMDDEDLDAKVIAGMLVIADEQKLKPLPSTLEPVIELVEEPMEEQKEVFSGRKPRVILLTNLKSCIPCMHVDRNIVSVLKTKRYQDAGWTVGAEEVNMVEVVDFDKNSEKFQKYVEMISDPEFMAVTPTFLRINHNGELDTNGILTGSVDLQTFIKFSKDFKDQ